MSVSLLLVLPVLLVIAIVSTLRICRGGEGGRGGEARFARVPSEIWSAHLSGQTVRPDEVISASAGGTYGHIGF
jgi:hypothetical protein